MVKREHEYHFQANITHTLNDVVSRDDANVVNISDSRHKNDTGNAQIAANKIATAAAIYPRTAILFDSSTATTTETNLTNEMRHRNTINNYYSLNMPSIMSIQYKDNHNQMIMSEQRRRGWFL